jgi:hypothetical protein
MNEKHCPTALLAFTLLLGGQHMCENADGANYDESKVPAYTLPDPLTTVGGDKVTDARTWRTKRRAELLALFESRMFGKAPVAPESVSFAIVEEDEKALGGKATRRQVSVSLTGKPTRSNQIQPTMQLLMYIPNGVEGPAPRVLDAQFQGESYRSRRSRNPAFASLDRRQGDQRRDRKRRDG